MLYLHKNDTTLPVTLSPVSPCFLVLVVVFDFISFKDLRKFLFQ